MLGKATEVFVSCMLVTLVNKILEYENGIASGIGMWFGEAQSIKFVPVCFVNC